LTDEELKAFPELPAKDVVPNHVARYLDMVALSRKEPARVIGPHSMLPDRPGFEVDFLTALSLEGEMQLSDRHNVLMGMRGHWYVDCDGGKCTLAPGDTMAIPPGLAYKISPAMSGECSLFRVANTDDPAGATARLL
jgi:hypothetical protein